MGRYRAEWGNDGRLWGTFQPSCVFNGLVDGFAEILILFGGSIVANIAAVLVVVGFGYAAAFQELFRPEFPALSRPDGTGDGKHHVTDAKVLFRAHDDLPFGGFQVQEVHEVAARQILELVVVAHLVMNRHRARSTVSIHAVVSCSRPARFMGCPPSRV